MQVFLGNSPRLVASAIAASLRDPKALVVRGVLDLMLGYFPLGTERFSKEMEIVHCQNCLAILLRRDVSLSRRVLAWLHGTTAQDLSSDDVLADNCASILQLAIMSQIKDTELQQTLKILSILAERPSIASIIPPIIGPILLVLSSSNSDKLFQAADGFFQDLELALLWRGIYLCFLEQGIVEGSGLLLFAINRLKIVDQEGALWHLPFALALLFPNEDLEAGDLVALAPLIATYMELVAPLLQSNNFEQIDFQSHLDEVRAGQVPWMTQQYCPQQPFVLFSCKIFQHAKLCIAESQLNSVMDQLDRVIDAILLADTEKPNLVEWINVLRQMAIHCRDPLTISRMVSHVLLKCRKLSSSEHLSWSYFEEFLPHVHSKLFSVYRW